MFLKFSKTFSILIYLIYASLSYAQVSVLTHHNDINRSGANLNETLLNTSNVNFNQFGKLFSYTVDMDIYTQPLYVPGVVIQGKGTHNVVYVATMNDSVYAFDADNNTGANSLPLWKANFTNTASGITPVPVDDVITDPTSGNIRRPGPIGIMGTPVIDPTTNTMYLVARTKETSGTGCTTAKPCYFQRLHALDITSGAEKFNGPIAIQATISGSGVGGINGNISFDPRIQNQRPGLVLDHGAVYIAWASHDDSGNYHGWVMAYDATTLQQTGVFNVTPNGEWGGIWQSGQPPVVDASGNLYLMTGNGTFDATNSSILTPPNQPDISQSFIKLSPRTLTLLDWFTQHDSDYWNQLDEDLNSGGVLMFPGSNLLLGGGKQGRFFLLNTGNLGKYDATDSQIPQSFQATSGNPIHGSPVYYNSPTRGPLTYLWGDTDYLKAFSFNGSILNPTPVSQSTFTAPQGIPGGFLSISANGSQANSGILWATMPYSLDAENAVVAGVLRAFDASNLSIELWNSRTDYIRDDLGNFAKFVPPTIANGKVYVSTFSGQLVVYGLNPPPPSGIIFVQEADATPQATTAAVPVTYSTSQSAGDLNIVTVGWNDATSTITSVTDSNHNTYQLAVGPTRSTGISQSIYYATNIQGGSNTVTVNFSQAVPYPDIRILEYYGINNINPVDVLSSASGSSANSSSGTVATTTANELLFAANTVATGTTQAGFPFVSRAITIPDGDIAQDAIVNTAGNYTATATLSSAGPWVMQMVGFKGQTNNLTVASVSPSIGSINGGTSVTITGTNFTTGATVSFGGVPATNVTVNSPTSITATTPTHAAGAVDVTVANSVSQSATLSGGFTYTSSSLPAPTLSAVTPTQGSMSGGTTVTISGSNFVSGATVSFGGTAASNVAFNSSTSLTATTPAHAAGLVNITITNPDGQNGTLTNAFTYTALAPTLTSVSPNSGSKNGGTVVTLTGTNFISGATATFGGTAATILTLNSTTITATTPGHAVGTVNVTVTNPDAQNATLSGGFTYTAPGINFIQVADAVPQSPLNRVLIPFSNVQGIGNLNIVVVGWNDATSTVQSVLDSNGNAYQLAVGPTRGAGLSQSIYYATNIKGGSNTVTVNFTQAVPYPDIRILEYTGLTNKDAAIGASGNSTSANSGAATTTAANELIFGANTVWTGNKTPGSGFTSRMITVPDGDLVEDKIVSTIGSYNTTAALTSSGPWVMQMVTFK
jgi:hypothetical protein